MSSKMHDLIILPMDSLSRSGPERLSLYLTLHESPDRVVPTQSRKDKVTRDNMKRNIKRSICENTLLYIYIFI